MATIALNIDANDIKTLKAALDALYSSVAPFMARDNAGLRSESHKIMLHCSGLQSKLNGAAERLATLGGNCPVSPAEPVAPIDKTVELIAKIKAAGGTPRSYSGRGMYGKECVSCSNWPCDEDLPAGYSLDSLGMGIIVYWRDVPWPADMEG